MRLKSETIFFQMNKTDNNIQSSIQIEQYKVNCSLVDPTGKYLVCGTSTGDLNVWSLINVSVLYFSLDKDIDLHLFRNREREYLQS